MASEQQTHEVISRLPEGGQIIVHYQQLTIESDSTKWLEYVVMVDGKEVSNVRCPYRYSCCCESILVMHNP